MIKDKLLFIHSPTNGGTFIQNIIFKQPYKSDFLKYVQNNTNINISNLLIIKFIKIISCIIYYLLSRFYYDEHWTLQKYSKHVNISNYNILFVCRNPYNRILSMYKFLNINTSIDTFLDNIEKCRNINYIGFSYDYLYLKILDKAIGLLKNQVDFIKYKDKIYPKVNVVKLEDKNALKLFCEKNKLIYSDKIVNQSNKIELKLTESQKNRIFSIYKKDFIFFNYPK